MCHDWMDIIPSESYSVSSSDDSVSIDSEVRVTEEKMAENKVATPLESEDQGRQGEG